MNQPKHGNRKSSRRARHEQKTTALVEDTPSNFLTRLALNAESRVLPINDPHREKELLEQHGAEKWLEYLRKKACSSALCVSPEEIRRRICEVYRLLYRQSESTKKKRDMISDFAAHFPQLVLDRSWLADFFIFERGGPHPDRPLVYEALGAGLRRAANSTPQERRARKLGQLAAARSFQQNIQREFKDFVDELFVEGSPKELAAIGWAEEMVSKKMQNLKTRFPRLSKVSDKIARLLLERHAYKSSIVAAAALFDVRERDLEGKLW